jgi:hypothetical protein
MTKMIKCSSSSFLFWFRFHVSLSFWWWMLAVCDGKPEQRKKEGKGELPKKILSTSGRDSQIRKERTSF